MDFPNLFSSLAPLPPMPSSEGTQQLHAQSNKGIIAKKRKNEENDDGYQQDIAIFQEEIFAIIDAKARELSTFWRKPFEEVLTDLHAMTQISKVRAQNLWNVWAPKAAISKNMVYKDFLKLLKQDEHFKLRVDDEYDEWKIAYYAKCLPPEQLYIPYQGEDFESGGDKPMLSVNGNTSFHATTDLAKKANIPKVRKQIVEQGLAGVEAIIKKIHKETGAHVLVSVCRGDKRDVFDRRILGDVATLKMIQGNKSPIITNDGATIPTAMETVLLWGGKDPSEKTSKNASKKPKKATSSSLSAGEVKHQISKLLIQQLEQTTGVERPKFPWAKWDNFAKKHKLEVVGWPVGVPFQHPSNMKVEQAGSNRAGQLLDAIQAGTIFIQKCKEKAIPSRMDEDSEAD